MPDVNVRRSQAILRMPVDYVDATLILHDGERSEVIFFVPPGEDLGRLLSDGPAFIPVMREAKIRIVARTAIACVGVASRAAAGAAGVAAFEAEMPCEKQRALVQLRSGVRLEGELSWTVVTGEQRTADFLNAPAAYVELRAVDKTYLVVKAHVASVQEL